MVVIAIAIKGQEFFYRASTAHKVNEKKADLCCKLLNDAKYKINDNEIWHKFNIGNYDNAAVYAECQSFTLGKKLKEIKS